MNFEQLKTILWLRWRLTRNQWTRSKGLGAVIAALVAFAMCLLAALSFAGGLAAGIFGLRNAQAGVITAVWAGVTIAFLFLWLIGLINEIQRSESIDLQRLMHLPVRLGQIFVINYVASHLTMGIVLVVPGIIGLAMGLMISKGALMVLMIPLALSMVFMITAWTYLLRGWLATLMSNPRRRRAVIMGITFVFILLSQAPNIYFNVLHGRGQRWGNNEGARPSQKANEQQMFKQLGTAQKFIPPLWVAVGAGALAQKNAVPALLGTVGCFGLGALGLRRAYLATVRFYQGGTGSRSHAGATSVRQAEPEPGPAKVRPKRDASPGFLEWRVPAVPEQAAAVALASFRSMLRAPEVKMAWGSSFLVTLILAASFVLRSPPKIPEAAKPLIACAAVMFSVFLLVQFFSNQFGFDRDGFRSLVLSPAERRLILLGKNLACVPVGAGFGMLLLVLMTFWLRLSPLTLLAAVLQLASVLLLAGMVGNLLSILAPYRIQPGSMKPSKMPGLAMLLLVACHLFFPLAMLPVLVPPLAHLLWRAAALPSSVPINLVLSVLMTALFATIYWQALRPLGRLLQRRETKIIGIVTVEVE